MFFLTSWEPVGFSRSTLVPAVSKKVTSSDCNMMPYCLAFKYRSYFRTCPLPPPTRRRQHFFLNGYATNNSHGAITFHIHTCVFLCVRVSVYTCLFHWPHCIRFCWKKAILVKKKCVIKMPIKFSAFIQAKFHYCNQNNQSLNRTLATLINSYLSYFL